MYTWGEVFGVCMLTLLLCCLLMARQRGAQRSSCNMYNELLRENEELQRLLHRRTVETNLLRETVDKYKLRRKRSSSQ